MLNTALGDVPARCGTVGVTQPLLYRYFPGKDDLIKEVYRKVYLEPLDTGWDRLLSDRARPLREFYLSYTSVISGRRWLRMYLYSQPAYFFISPRYQSPIWLAVINTTPSWPRT